MPPQLTMGSPLRGALAGFSRAAETAGSQRDNFASRMSRLALLIVLCLIAPGLASAQNAPSGPPLGPEADKCAALAGLDLESVPGGSAIITSAQLVEVPASGLEKLIFPPSGFARSAAQSTTPIHHYCDVTGYVAPQNKFELKLPLPADWNQKFFFFACSGFCGGGVIGRRCNLGLARGYASVTGNRGREKRGEKAKRQTLQEWLDYQGKLTAQNLSRRHLVLYNHSGTNVSAAHFDRHTCPLHFVVDVKLYWAAFSDPVEADYVTAVLNSQYVNDCIKPFQSTGLLGERDVHKKLLELPIPIYNSAAKEHQRLAELGERARHEAADTVKSPGFPAATSLARQRAFVRQNLKDTLIEIDRLVRRIL